MSKPLTQTLDKDSTSDGGIWLTSVYGRYFARPKTVEFNNMCLAQFVADYNILSSAEGKKSKREHKHNLGKGLGSIEKKYT